MIQQGRPEACVTISGLLPLAAEFGKRIGCVKAEGLGKFVLGTEGRLGSDGNRSCACANSGAAVIAAAKAQAMNEEIRFIGSILVA